ncbi:hypothetical protein [Paenibacillus sp.]|nr:hypothetical protein [Paenibacillus sp.]HZG57613.1 hypothetical protein [Paenibacillus sp.]
MPRSRPYDDTVTEQQREVQEALMSLPGIGPADDEDDDLPLQSDELK